MQFDLVTPEKLVVSGNASQVIATGSEGSLGVLENHQPLISALIPGSLIVMDDDTKTEYFVGGGFIDVAGGKVTVLAEEACEKASIDVTDCKTRLTKATNELNKLIKSRGDAAAIELLKQKQTSLSAQIKVAEMTGNFS